MLSTPSLGWSSIPFLFSSLPPPSHIWKPHSCWKFCWNVMPDTEVLKESSGQHILGSLVMNKGQQKEQQKYRGAYSLHSLEKPMGRRGNWPEPETGLHFFHLVTTHLTSPALLRRSWSPHQVDVLRCVWFGGLMSSTCFLWDY